MPIKFVNDKTRRGHTLYQRLQSILQAYVTFFQKAASRKYELPGKQALTLNAFSDIHSAATEDIPQHTSTEL